MNGKISRRHLLRSAFAVGTVTLASACGNAGNSGQQPAPTTGMGAGGQSNTAPTEVAGTAAATSGADAGAQATTAPAEGATTGNTAGGTVRVWGYGLDDARAQARLSEFNKAYPDIKVEPVGGELNTQQLLTAVAGGDPPEVINVDRVQTGSWAGRGAIDPIDELVQRDGFDLNQFYPFTVDQVRYNGQLYAVPQFVNIDMIFMNGDVLKEVGVDPASVDPGNWEQLQSLAEQLHKQDGNAVTRTGFDTKVQDGRLWLWSWANGVNLIESDGKTMNFNHPKVVEALTWARDTVNKQGGEQARAAFSQAQNFFSAQNPVLIGQTAMTVFEQWLIGVMKVNPQANFVALLPRVRNSQENLTDATGAAFAIPRGVQGEKRDAAWNFIKGMTSREAWLAGERATLQDAESKNEPFTPTISGNQAVDTEVWSNLYKSISPSYDATVKLFPEALKVARARYSGPVASQINEVMTAQVNDALQGVKEPQGALDELQQQAQQALAEFGG
jgi:multiple sugar transport system substrate-binding protein